jgi:hypothetical protein
VENALEGKDQLGAQYSPLAVGMWVNLREMEVELETLHG